MSALGVLQDGSQNHPTELVVVRKLPHEFGNYCVMIHKLCITKCKKQQTYYVYVIFDIFLFMLFTFLHPCFVTCIIMNIYFIHHNVLFLIRRDNIIHSIYVSYQKTDPQHYTILI